MLYLKAWSLDQNMGATWELVGSVPPCTHFMVSAVGQGLPVFPMLTKVIKHVPISLNFLNCKTGTEMLL